MTIWMTNSGYVYYLRLYAAGLICGIGLYRLMLQIRPTEIKSVANLLMQEHDDVEILARAVIDLVDTIRAQRELYVLAEIHPSLGVAKAVGPYATSNQAMKDLNLLTKYDTHSRAYLCRLKDPSNVIAGTTL